MATIMPRWTSKQASAVPISNERLVERRLLALPPSVHFIYHVPKCAGRTIHSHVEKLLPPGAYHRTRKRRGFGRLLLGRHNSEKITDLDQIRAVGGHYLGLSTDALFSGREIKRSILLRDPVSHIISHYNFRMMRYQANGLHPYSFDLAYRARRRNYIAHYILTNFLELSWYQIARLSEEDKYELINAFLAGFWYVADYSFCDNLIAALGCDLHVSTVAMSTNTRDQWEARVDWRPLQADDLSPGFLAQIRRENLLDQRLWDTWHEAQDQTAQIRPRALGDRVSPGLVPVEARRFISQIARRLQRRWGILEGLRAVPKGRVDG
jgi:hypothetical protein